MQLYYDNAFILTDSDWIKLLADIERLGCDRRGGRIIASDEAATILLLKWGKWLKVVK